MTDILGRLRTPRLASAPATPVVGEMYYDTALNKLYWWNGTSWIAASGASEVYEQPAQPASTTVGALWIDTDDVPPAWTSQIPLVTALPSNPIDGQEVYYQAVYNAGADAVIWHLRFRASSGYADKWEVVGGAPLHAEQGAAGGVLNPSASWQAPPGGCSVTPARAGVYDVWVVSRSWNAGNLAGSFTVGIKRGATAPIAAEQVGWAFGAAGASIAQQNVVQRRFRCTVTAGLVLELQVLVQSVSQSVGESVIEALPVRLS